MAEMRVSIGAPQLPEGCVQLVGGRVICDKPQIMPGCKLLKDNKLDCSDVGQENCKLVDNITVCESDSAIVHVAPKGSDVDMQDVFIGHAYLVVIVAILSFTLTQAIKTFILKNFKKNAKDTIIRLCAVFTGGFVAYTLSDPFQMIDVYLGASAGALNAFVIKMFKLKVKKSLGVEESDG